MTENDTVPGIFFFRYSLERKTIISSSQNADVILGTSVSSLSSQANVFLRHVASEDRFDVFEAFERSLVSGTYDMSYRWIRPDSGEIHWLRCRAEMSEKRDELVGYIHQLPKKFQYTFGGEHRLLDSFPETIFVIDSNLIIQSLHITISAEALKSFGIVEDLVRTGKKFLKTLPDLEKKKQLQKIFSDLLEGKEQLYTQESTFEKERYTLECFPIQSKNSQRGVVLRIYSGSREERTTQQPMTGDDQAFRMRVNESIHHVNNALQAISTHVETFSHGDAKYQYGAAQSIRQLAHYAGQLTQKLNDQLDHNDQVSLLNLNSVILSLLQNLSQNSSEVSISTHFGITSTIFCNEKELFGELRGLFLEILQASPPETRVKISTRQQNGKIICSIEARLPKESKPQSLPLLFIDSVQQSLAEGRLKNFLKSYDAQLVKNIDETDYPRWEISFEAAESLAEFSASQEKLDPIAIRATILLVDDDPIILSSIRAIFEQHGIEVVTATSGKDALRIAEQRKEELSLVVLEAIMPDTSGSTLVTTLRKIIGDIPIVGFSGAAKNVSETLVRAGADALLLKPMSPTELLSSVTSFLEYSISRDNASNHNLEEDQNPRSSS